MSRGSVVATALSCKEAPGVARGTLELAAAGAAKVLGPINSATQALARASITMTAADLWHARLALKTLRRDQREAIADAVEQVWETADS